MKTESSETRPESLIDQQTTYLGIIAKKGPNIKTKGDSLWISFTLYWLKIRLF